MKWLIVHPGPNFSVADVYTGWSEALRDAGEKVSRYALDERLTFYGNALVEAGEGRFRKAFDGPAATARAIDGLYSHLYRWQPDVLLVVSGFFVPSDLLDLARQRGTRVVVLHTESPYEDGRQLALAEHADLNLLNDPTNLDQYRQVAPTEYIPHAYRPAVHHPGPARPEMVADLAMVGTGYPSRIAYLEAMHYSGALDGLDVLLAGNWQALGDESPLRKHVGHDIGECLDNRDTADVYRSARMGINLYRRESERPELSAGWSMGPREVEMAACGMPYLREPRGEGDEVLPMLPRVTTPAEAGEALRWWLDRDDLRQETARLARAAIADRTFDNHAARLLRWLDK
jgi:glycosyltransferase involved in cell wall biosynthesis